MTGLRPENGIEGKSRLAQPPDGAGLAGAFPKIHDPDAGGLLLNCVLSDPTWTLFYAAYVSGGRPVADSLALEVFFRGRYRILAAERDRDLFETVVSNLDHGVRRIEEVFSTKAVIPFLNVFICPSRSTFDDFVQVITTVPTSAGRIGQPQGHDMYILSPKSYRADAPFYGRDAWPFYDPVDLQRLLVHELVHVWEELVSPREAMDVGEDWFSEGMAMYIAEHNQEANFELELRADYSKGIIPKPEELSGDRTYSWGCVLFEFLLEEVGPKRLLEMITKTTHENVIALLQLEPSSFWKRYLDYVETRMGTPSHG